MADKTKTFSTRIKSKRDTSANWESANPVLLNGEKIIVDTAAGEIREKIGDGVKTYSQLPFTDEKIRGMITEKADEIELERIKYYGDKDIVPSPESYFTVNATGNAITGLTDAGKTQTELVIPYKINGIEITNLHSENDVSILDGATNVITKIIIPNSVTSIGDFAFIGCSSLTSINIPNSVTSIGIEAFYGCSSLTSINIPNGITSIGDYDFAGCSSLISINIPNSVTNIGNWSFSGCTSLTSINIPNSVTSFEVQAFYGCTNLKIYCEQGSYAETYAKTNNIPVVYTDVKTDVVNLPLETGEGTNSIKHTSATQAISDGAIAFGNNTIAGSKCFNITAFDDTNKTYTLDSVDGLAVNDVFSLKLNNNYDNFGKIIAIDGNVVTVDNYQKDETSDVKYFRVALKPLCGTTDFGVNAFTSGDNCIALGDNSFAEGKETKAMGRYSHAEGRNTQAGYSAHAEGRDTIASGVTSHAEGTSTIASGNYSHASGYNAKAYGGVSFATGNGCIASGSTSFAHGIETQAIADASHVEGQYSIAGGTASHAEGYACKTYGDCSHVEGRGTKAGSAYIHVQGKYNVNDTENKYAHIVGNGTSDTNRSNAHTLDWSGNAWYAGNVKVGGTSYSDANAKELATKEYVDNSVSSAGGGDMLKSVYDKDNDGIIDDVALLQYYGTTDITISDESYFIVNDTGETIIGLTDTGKTQTELVIPYKINGIEITNLESPEEGISILEGSNVTKVILPNTIKTIGTWAFGEYSLLSSINIPNSVTTIGTRAFCNSGLTTINIPDSVITIGEDAFNMSNIKSIYIPNSIKNWGTDVFSYSSLIAVDIEEGSTIMPAFDGCTSLKSINIPKSITSIGSALMQCSSLKTIAIPYGETSICRYAFYDCSSLTEVKIPNSVTSIGESAFSECISLTRVEIPNSVTSIESTAFDNSPNVTIYCEQGSYAETYAKDNNIPVVYTDVKAIALVGQKTAEGGEIFNDYTNNQASGESSHAEGSFTNASIVNSHAEGRFTSTAIKGFKVLEIDATNNKARLSKDDVSKLSLWNKIGVVDRNNTYYSGSITKIDGVWVTISSSVSVNKFIVNPTSTNIQGYLIPYAVNNGKPIGSIELNTDALSVSSHTEGSGTHSFLDAHAEGKNVFAPGKASHGEGLGTQSVGDYSHAEGHYSVSKGNGSHSEGDNSISSGDYSHAENYNTRANAESSHTEGIRCITTVDAKGGHAEGADTKVNAYAAHAEGNNTIASSEAQHVEGTFNIEDTENKYIHIAGNGYVDSNNNEIRQNAHTIDRGGNAWFSGWVKIGGSSFDDENAQYLITDQILQGVLSETEKKYDEINVTLEQKADKTPVNAALERIKYYGSADIVPSDESYFTVNETGETITGLTAEGKTQTELVIPYKINGVTITTIGLNAMYMNSSINSVILPNCITTIKGNAFGLSSLLYINIPKSVVLIENAAFGTSNLKKVEILHNNITINQGAFQLCSDLTIYCEQGSVADIYAKSEIDMDGNSIPVIYTDVDPTQYLSKTNTTEFTPTADYQPATKKYVDDITSSFVSGKVTNVTVPTTGWTTATDSTGETYFTINITNSALTSTGYPLCDVVLPDDIAAARLQDEAYKCIGKITINDGSVTLCCFDEIPSVSFTMRIQIMYI